MEQSFGGSLAFISWGIFEENVTTMAKNVNLDSLGDTVTYLSSMGWSDLPGRTVLIADGVLKKTGYCEASKATIRRVVATAVAAARGRAVAKARLADRRKASPKKPAARVAPQPALLDAAEKPVSTAETSSFNARALNFVDVSCNLSYLEGVAQLFEEPESAVFDDVELIGVICLIKKRAFRQRPPSPLCPGSSGLLALPPFSGGGFEENVQGLNPLDGFEHPPSKLKHFISLYRVHDMPLWRVKILSGLLCMYVFSATSGEMVTIFEDVTYDQTEYCLFGSEDYFEAAILRIRENYQCSSLVEGGGVFGSNEEHFSDVCDMGVASTCRTQAVVAVRLGEEDRPQFEDLDTAEEAPRRVCYNLRIVVALSKKLTVPQEMVSSPQVVETVRNLAQGKL